MAVTQRQLQLVFPLLLYLPVFHIILREGIHLATAQVLGTGARPSSVFFCCPNPSVASRSIYHGMARASGAHSCHFTAQTNLCSSQQPSLTAYTHPFTPHKSLPFSEVHFQFPFCSLSKADTRENTHISSHCCCFSIGKKMPAK